MTYLNLPDLGVTTLEVIVFLVLPRCNVRKDSLVIKVEEVDLLVGCFCEDRNNDTPLKPLEYAHVVLRPSLEALEMSGRGICCPELKRLFICSSIRVFEFAHRKRHVGQSLPREVENLVGPVEQYQDGKHPQQTSGRNGPMRIHGCNLAGQFLDVLGGHVAEVRSL